MIRSVKGKDGGAGIKADKRELVRVDEVQMEEGEPGRNEWELNTVLLIEKEEIAHLKIGSRVSVVPMKSR